MVWGWFEEETPYASNNSDAKKSYEQGLKIDGFEELVTAHPDSAMIIDGVPPTDFPDTPEKLIEKHKYISKEKANEIFKAAGQNNADFKILASAYASLQRNKISRDINNASTKTAEELADKLGLTGDERKKLIKKESDRLTKAAFASFGSGDATPEGAIKNIEDYAAQEYAKASSFIHQNYLLANSGEINKKLRTPTAYPNYDRTLVSNIPNSSGNPLGIFTGKKEAARLLTFTTQQLSSLVPHIKLFKVLLSGNKRTKVEIPFPTISLGYSQTGKIFRQSPKDDGTYFKNRDGFGIKSFEWQNNGISEATKFSDLSANLSIYFQDFAQLTAKRQDAAGHEFTYLDLIIPKESIGAKDDNVSQTDQAFIVAEVGWSTSAPHQLFTPNDLQTIKESRISMFLQQKNYELDFDSGTTSAFTLNIEYHSAYELMAKDSNINALLPSESLCEKIKEKQDQIAAAKKKASSGDDSKNSDTLKKLNDEFDKIKEAATKDSYKYIFENLMQQNKIHYLKAGLAQILNFQGVDKTIVSKIAKVNKLTGDQEDNLQKNISTWQDAAADENDDSEDIYFFYLGDLLEIIIKNSTDKNKLKKIGYDSNVAQTIRLLTTNIPFGSEEINIADIPVDVRLLANFFYEEVIAKKSLTITLNNFIKALLTKLIENKIEKFSENYTPSRNTYQTTFIDSKNDEVGLHTDAAKLSKKFQGGTNYSYLTIYAIPKAGAEFSLIDPNNYRKSKQFDLDERGIYHFVFGSTDSIVKSANFSKSDIENLKEQRIFESQSPYAILANLFTVSLDMFGNTLFYPGRLIYINPAHSLGGTGRPWEKGSAYQVMGLGGYHQIRTVKNQISDGVFSTQLEVDFISSGNKIKKNKRK